MTQPIAKPAHVTPRPRRRQGPRPLFRAVLVAALAISLLLATPLFYSAFRSTGNRGAPGTGGQVAMSGLQPGACTIYGSAGKIVFLDPGHGGADPGVVGLLGDRQVREKDVTLAVATRLKALLLSDRYRVVMARTSDSTVIKLSDADVVSGAMTFSAVHRDLVARTQCANAAGAAVMISIHLNAFADPSASGTETFYNAERTFASENKRLAESVQAAMVAGLSSSNRGAWTDDQLTAPALTIEGRTYGHLIELGPAEPGWVDKPSQMPGALVEPLFLTNADDARLASDPEGQQRIAVALRIGLEKYLTGP